MILSACELSQTYLKERFDTQNLSLCTLNLFNQQENPRNKNLSWVGDWVFRRKRLLVAEKTFFEEQPDLLFFQEALSKANDRNNSDENLLKSSGLKGYDFKRFKTRDLVSSSEVESLIYSASNSIKFSDSHSSLWSFGQDGYLSVTSAEYKSKPLLLFNVQMPRKDSIHIASWYSFIEKRIKGVLAQSGICANRVIVAGSFLGKVNHPSYINFLRSLSLKDSSSGFCENKEQCFTRSNENEISQQLFDVFLREQIDRVLVHTSAEVISASLAFTNKVPAPIKFKEKYGLVNLFTSERFGWKTSVRLASCPKKGYIF